MIMKLKLFLIILSAILIADSKFAQQKYEKIAFEGPNGIFVNTGSEIPFSASGKIILFKYKIERSLANQNSWSEVTQLSAPENYSSFLNNIYTLNQQLKDSIPASVLPLELIWKKAKQFERLDSLKYLGNPLIIRMALGVTYLDKEISPNQKYVYKITKLDRDGNSIESFTTNAVSFPGKYQNNLFTIFSKDASDKFIRLTWKADAASNPARFNVFRRENFQDNFSLINPVLIYNSDENQIVVTIVDSLVQKNNTYEYYLLPLDYYQNEGTASDTVTLPAFSFNKIFPPYNIKVEGDDSLDGLKLNWSFDNKNDITSLKIFRSVYSEKDFKEIAEVTGFDSIYFDRTAEPMIKYFYYFQINDQFGEVPLSSAKVFGLYQSKQIPPPPFYLHTDSTLTGVKLIWNKPDEYVNTYHIYRNFGNDEILSELSSIKSSDPVIQFIDTTSTLKGDKIYYYSVRAENTSGRLSNFSDTVQVFPKVKAIITTPKLLKGYTLDGKVFLYWENLFAENQNLEGYKVFRKNKAFNISNENFVALFDSLLSPKQNNYVDTSCIAGNDYEYTVKSYDISGAESEYSPYIEITLPTDPVLPPSGLTITNRDNGILIQWDPPISNKIKNVKIFRYERGSEPIQIGNVNADEFQFLDTSTIKDNLYFYFIISVDNYGSESNRSEELGIRRL